MSDEWSRTQFKASEAQLKFHFGFQLFRVQSLSILFISLWLLNKFRLKKSFQQRSYLQQVFGRLWVQHMSASDMEMKEERIG